MKNEQLRICDEYGSKIGVASREDVHRFGYWHEIFNCWFYSVENDIPYIYLQLRASDKNDYPNLLDITVAGHLHASESTKDGIREIKEEIGIDVNFKDLISLGDIRYSLVKDNFIDNEIAHMYLYRYDNLFNDVSFNEEVSGLIRVRLSDFGDLWLGKTSLIKIDTVMIKNSHQCPMANYISRNNFVPYPVEFYKFSTTQIQKITGQ